MKKVSMSFDIHADEYKKFDEWNNNHIKKCKLYGTDGAIGGRLEFCFRPTGLGNIITVKCDCNSKDSKYDLTDVGNW